MEDIVNGIIAQDAARFANQMSQISGNELEQASQEFERAIEEASSIMANGVVQGTFTLSQEEEATLAQALESEHQEIPVNSQTITVDETTSRFSGAIWYEEIQKQTVTLAGVGGIGRFGNLINF